MSEAKESYCLHDEGGEPDELDMAEKDVKPCPFCGGAPALLGWISHEDCVHVSCERVDTCPASPNTTMCGLSAKEAVEEWNTRS